MSLRNNDLIPDPTPNETVAQYITRLDKLYYDHLDGCRDCNYDHECMACNADIEEKLDEAQMHSCNCTVHGWGVRIRQKLRNLRSEAKGWDASQKQASPIPLALRQWRPYDER